MRFLGIGKKAKSGQTHVDPRDDNIRGLLKYVDIRGVQFSTEDHSTYKLTNIGKVDGELQKREVCVVLPPFDLWKVQRNANTLMGEGRIMIDGLSYQTLYGAARVISEGLRLQQKKSF